MLKFCQTFFYVETLFSYFLVNKLLSQQIGKNITFRVALMYAPTVGYSCQVLSEGPGEPNKFAWRRKRIGSTLEAKISGDFGK